MRNATDVAFCIQDVGSPFPVYVPGGAIAFPASTTAQGLFKVGNIDIDAHDAVASSVDMGNTAGSGFTLNVHGSEVIDNNLTVTVDASIKGYAYCNSLVAKYDSVSTFGFLFDGTPTAARTVTLQDMSGTVAMLEANPQTFTGLQSFNASANFRTGTADYYDGFGYHTFRVGMDARTVGFFDVAPVVQQGATTAVPAAPALVGVDTVDLPGLVAQLAALRTTVEELRARLTAYGLTP